MVTKSKMLAAGSMKFRNKYSTKYTSDLSPREPR
jgi:hypothetical protein